MKTNHLLGLLMVFFLSVGFTSCNDDDHDKWYNSIPDGGPFWAGNWMRFHYVDEEGNDLIDMDDFTTYPLSSSTLTPPETPTSTLGNGSYNNSINSVWNRENGIEFFTFAYGDSRQQDFTFYVFFKGKADVMEIRHKYQKSTMTDVIDGEIKYSSTIVSWKVNGELVYDIKEASSHYRHVYLVKSGDNTRVTFEKPEKK